MTDVRVALVIVNVPGMAVIMLVGVAAHA